MEQLQETDCWVPRTGLRNKASVYVSAVCRLAVINGAHGLLCNTAHKVDTIFKFYIVYSSSIPNQWGLCYSAY